MEFKETDALKTVLEHKNLSFGYFFKRIYVKNSILMKYLIKHRLNLNMYFAVNRVNQNRIFRKVKESILMDFRYHGIFKSKRKNQELKKIFLSFQKTIRIRTDKKILKNYRRENFYENRYRTLHSKKTSR